MADLDFSIKLKEQSVFITGEDGVRKEYMIKELSGDQRTFYDDSFDLKVVIEKGVTKVASGQNFKNFATSKFLAMCLYDENGKLVPESTIGKYPSVMLESIHKAAKELSGLGQKALDTAKNELEVSDSSGLE